MAGRRGRGEGTISQRTNGRWMAQVDLGWQDGRRHRKSVYGVTRHEVATKLQRLLRAVQQGFVVSDERQTIAHVLARWLDHKKSRLRARVWLTYEQTVRLHVVPGLGKIPLARLKVDQVEAWFDHHQANGATARTIRYARAVLRVALNKALKAGLVAQNAAALADPPTHVPRKIQPLTPVEARTLLDVARRHRQGAIVSVGMALGLRLGEALGLQWADIDFKAGTLAVKRALERSGGDAAARRDLAVRRRAVHQRFVAAAPHSVARQRLREECRALRDQWRAVRTVLRTTELKTERSARTLSLPPVVLAALKSHHVQQRAEWLAAGCAWPESVFVFCTPIGTPVDPRNATRDFHAMRREAGLETTRFHDLRHTAATLLLAMGVDPRTIMHTLGHSQISLTMNTYTHVLPALQAEAAAKMNAILGGE
jgi:integrase